MTSILACDWCSVADSSVVFDSEYMVFVSPPPAEKSKAVAPIMPFNIYVRIYYLLSMYLSTHKLISKDVGCGDRPESRTRIINLCVLHI